MKAIFKAKREHGIEVQEIPVPEIGVDEVLLKIKASTICGSDVHYYEWSPGVFYKGAPFSLGP
jgi:threonine 3-dehydrogenase